MKKLALLVATCGVLGMAAPAQAGCLTGAAVGAVAGHMMGHGVAGAAAGCAIGHHSAAKKEERAQHDQQQPQTPQNH